MNIFVGSVLWSFPRPLQYLERWHTHTHTVT